MGKKWWRDGGMKHSQADKVTFKKSKRKNKCRAGVMRRHQIVSLELIQ
jgi:hypothetical protein